MPAVLVVMNVAYAFSAWPAGALSDRIGRFGVLSVGFALLLIADLMLALGGNIAGSLREMVGPVGTVLAGALFTAAALAALPLVRWRLGTKHA